MALKTCPHCGHSVSDKATKCPQCGKTLFRSRGNVLKCLDEKCGYEIKGKKKAKKDDE